MGFIGEAARENGNDLIKTHNGHVCGAQWAPKKRAKTLPGPRNVAAMLINEAIKLLLLRGMNLMLHLCFAGDGGWFSFFLPRYGDEKRGEGDR